MQLHFLSHHFLYFFKGLSLALTRLSLIFLFRLYANTGGLKKRFERLGTEDT